MEGSNGCVWVEEECRTPRHRSCQIPAALECPLAPRKKPAAYEKQQSTPPKQGYFQPPDLEVLFSIEPRGEAYYATN
ncbi:hypothetical protein Vadar_004400 [Vaccinium darrowii]|uniref:Uncharacterized protein n=1 Tax=Vaccinium darrowii TaxID=229202 RepID=A0ACB7YJ24_9ERIC|nr:hypothetical protein Vadar_004400 [Vaccinium darrowii]